MTTVILDLFSVCVVIFYVFVEHNQISTKDSDLTSAVGDVGINKLEKNKMDTKVWWKSKTLWVAIAQGGLGIIVALKAVDPAIADLGWVAVVKSIIDMFLRMGTTTAIE